MAISESYVVEYLLQGTASAPPDIVWQEQDNEASGYRAQIGDVKVELSYASFRGGSRLLLRFHHAQDDVDVHEPEGRGWMGKKHSNEEDRSLARKLRSLMQAAALQCQRRRVWAQENATSVRERVFRHLLFNESSPEQELEATGAKK